MVMLKRHLGVSHATNHPLRNRCQRCFARHGEGLPSDWLNDAVRIFASGQPEFLPFGDFPSHGQAGLRVLVASPHYILAMKLLAMRDPFATNDLRDVWELLDICAVRTLDQAQDWLRRFFPDRALPERHALILEDVFEAKAAGQIYSPMLGWGL
jgi:hypothetical protein